MIFKNKKILVVGAGISGISVAKVLQEIGAQVCLSDSKKIEDVNHDLTGLIDSGVSLNFGEQDEAILADLDYMIISPGISINAPLVLAAKAKGIIVLSEVEVAFQLAQAPILAVTGTNGKTTTTTLLSSLLTQTGKKVHVGGNLGMALSNEAILAQADDLIIAEISSFQLEGVCDFKPHIAAILNITPDHIDRHGNLENYQAAKEKIFAQQDENDFLVLNYDDTKVAKLAAKSKGKVLFFSTKATLREGIFLENHQIVSLFDGEKNIICHKDDLQIKGEHNIQNAMAACAFGIILGLKAEVLAKVLKEFKSVEHRIEFVDTINGIEYYNDSKATNPESAIKALEAFAGGVILLAGGHDKMTDLTQFMQEIKKKTVCLILIGEATARFKENALKHKIDNIYTATSMEDAVAYAHEIAKINQVVLLSPACSSYDMFKNYEERGKVFKQLVKNLKR